MMINLKVVKVEGCLGYEWVFDLEGIVDMYKFYEDINLWQIIFYFYYVKFCIIVILYILVF